MLTLNRCFHALPLVCSLSYPYWVTLCVMLLLIVKVLMKVVCMDDDEGRER